MAIDRRLRDRLDGPVPPAPHRRWRAAVVVTATVAVVAGALVLAWTRDDGTDVVATAGATSAETAIATSNVTATVPVEETASTTVNDEPTASSMPGDGRIDDPTIGGAPAVPAAAGPSADADAQIEAAVEVLFSKDTTADEKLAVVDRSAGLRELMERGLADPRQAVLETRVVSITYRSADEAVLELAFSLSPATYTLTFVRTTAGWQAERTSYCALVATGAPPCPAEEPAATAG